MSERCMWWLIHHLRPWLQEPHMRNDAVMNLWPCNWGTATPSPDRQSVDVHFPTREKVLFTSWLFGVSYHTQLNLFLTAGACLGYWRRQGITECQAKESGLYPAGQWGAREWHDRRCDLLMFIWSPGMTSTSIKKVQGVLPWWPSG